MSPKDRLPGWPQQAAWLRVQCAFTMISPFMDESEYLSIRGRISQWNLESEEANCQRAETQRKTA